MTHTFALIGWFIFIPAVLVFFMSESFEKFWMTLAIPVLGAFCAALAVVVQIRVSIGRFLNKRKEKTHV